MADKSAEHAYQYSRATFLGATTTAANVSKAGKAEEAKRAVSNLPNSLEWDACKQKVMDDIVSSKFTQNPDLQNKLLSMGETPLLEATYDSYWGCGLPLSARKLRQGEWHGKNYLGIILAVCRLEIKCVCKLELQPAFTVPTFTDLKHIIKSTGTLQVYWT